MSYQYLEQSEEDGVHILTMNRPDSLNALSEGLVKELTQAVEALKSAEKPARCLLITGAGRGFSSGADLMDKKLDGGRMPDLSESLKSSYNPLIKAIDALPIPIIAAVNGPAAGAGMSLALSADFVIAAQSAYFLQAFVRIGLAPDAGSTYFLTRLIGRARAAQLMMLGEKLPARTALDWGLIYKVVADESLMDEAMSLAKTLASGPTKSYAAIRKLIRASAHNDLNAQLDLEADMQKDLGYSEDFKAGVMGFITKQPAKFQGR